jgi:uncharacterized protein Yka (UPF0111/DUF47 family)
MAPYKNPNYFDLLEKGAGLALTAANMLKEMICSGIVSEELIAAVKKVEQDADSHMRLICGYLSTAFITPIDRDDIYRIAKKTDDITDSIDSASSRMWMMNATRITPAMKTMADYIVKACEKHARLLSELRNFKKKNRINEKTAGIRQIGEMSNECCKDAVRELFIKERDPIGLLKIKEVYGGLTEVLESCQDAADCIQAIIMTKT